MPPEVSENSPAAATAVDRVLEPAFLAHLGRMRLRVRSAYGPRPGDTPVRGLVQAGGLEVERHKAYDHGDELRHLDWNAYARLDQLLVRQFRAEREAPVHVFVDTSASMDTPASDGKLAFAAALALSLAYVAIRHHNPARVVALAEGGARASPAVRFPARLPLLARFCAGLAGGGRTALERGLGDYVRAEAIAGLAIVISDFLVDTDEARAALQHLAARGYEIVVLRPIGAGERDPSALFERARVRDAEDGSEKIVRLTPQNLARYRQALAAHLADLEAWCADHEATFAVCDTAAGLEQTMFTHLPRLGVLR